MTTIKTLIMNYIYYSILIISFSIIGLYQSLTGKMRDEVGEENTKYFLSQIRILKIIQIISFIIPAVILLTKEIWYWAISKYIVLYFLITFLIILNTLKISHKSKMYLIISLGLINILLFIIYTTN